MRARDRDLPEGAGAAFGLEHGVVGIGDSHGPKGARMVERFADLPDGTFVWTRGPGGEYRLGRIAGPLRFDDSPAAREAGIHHVRPAEWLERAFGDREVPPAVAHTFAVASGLDSLVVGESQILGQVKHALTTCQNHGTVGTVLNSLFQQALRVGKRVQTETEIGGAGRRVVGRGNHL